MVVFVSCCREVSASRPLLVNELCCLVNWLSICRKFSRLCEPCLSIVFIHVVLETVPCINSAHEFTRVNELCCLVNWSSICRRFSRSLSHFQDIAFSGCNAYVHVCFKSFL